MVSDKLKDSLQQLRAELDRLQSGDPVARQHIEQLLAQIETHPAGDAAQRHTLRANLADAIRRFEVKHPTLTACLGEIAAALS
ncbi:MAG TPA: DUF4404 family protein [Nevskia sp.]|nr:DUF4404 family protein [Nevskia sp.]